MWNGRTGKFIKVLASQNRSVLSISITPNSQYVLSGIGGSGSGGNECRVFSIHSGKKITSFTKHTDIVLATDISPDGRTAATGGAGNQEIYLWDLTTGILYDYGKLDGVSGSLAPKVVWSPEGNQVLFFLTDLTEGGEYLINLYQTDLLTGEKLILLEEALITSADYIYITNLYWR